METPKYKIGDTIFTIEYQKIVEYKITGIFAIYQKKFKEFRYYCEIKEGIENYGWKPERDIFTTKEELLASL